MIVVDGHDSAEPQTPTGGVFAALLSTHRDPGSFRLHGSHSTHDDFPVERSGGVRGSVSFHLRRRVHHPVGERWRVE